MYFFSPPSTVGGPSGALPISFSTSSSESMPKLATLNYQITSVLASGPNATVLLIAGRDVGGGRFALKVLKPDEEAAPANPADDLNLDDPGPKAKRAREPFELRVERARAEWQ